MSPDRRRTTRKGGSPPRHPVVRTRPAQGDPYEIVYFQRHIEDDPDQSAPGRLFLDTCPPKVRSLMRNVLIAVAASKPGQFAGGGYWEAMHGDMTGYFEVRVDGPKRRHYRLFCLLDEKADGRGPLLVVLTGLSKLFRTVLSSNDYKYLRKLGDEYLSRNPRSLVS